MRKVPVLHELQWWRSCKPPSPHRRFETGLMCLPAMLILDEPAFGLSLKLKDKLAEAVPAAISETGIPPLPAERNIAFVLSLVERMYLLDHGDVARGSTVGHDEIMQMYFGDRSAR